eukprot:768741-Hanusia_phi.AAC.8
MAGVVLEHSWKHPAGVLDEADEARVEVEVLEAEMNVEEEAEDSELEVGDVDLGDDNVAAHARADHASQLLLHAQVPLAPAALHQHLQRVDGQRARVPHGIKQGGLVPALEAVDVVRGETLATAAEALDGKSLVERPRLVLLDLAPLRTEEDEEELEQGILLAIPVDQRDHSLDHCQPEPHACVVAAPKQQAEEAVDAEGETVLASQQLKEQLHVPQHLHRRRVVAARVEKEEVDAAPSKRAPRWLLISVSRPQCSRSCMTDACL